MSTLSVDHGGGGGNVTAAADSVKKLIGKENASRPTSRIRAPAVSQKPVMKPMPRIENSTDCVRNRDPRVSIGENDTTRISENVRAKKDPFRDSDVCENVIRRSIESGKEMELKNEKNGIFGSGVLDAIKIGSISSRSNLESWNLVSNLDSVVKGFEGVRVLENSKVKSENGGKSLNRSSGLESNKEKGVKEERVGGRTTDKYPSKLHEKLAFLEGKVERIASDIKRTKEMLDMNNPDASNVILSDIQETIAEIEKAMGHVVKNDDQNSGLGKFNENDNLQINFKEKCPSKQADDTKSSVKWLNAEELEARFFPHYRLLRDRNLLIASSGNHQICDTKIEQPTSELKVEEIPLCSIDENLTAIRCLASSDGKGNANLEIYEVKEIEDVVDSAEPNSSDGLKGKDSDEVVLTGNETVEDSDVQGNVQDMKIDEETEDSLTNELKGIGHKTCTAGWFVSEEESVLLAYADGSCSFYDIVNNEEKVEYKLPNEMMPNLWGDCWILSAPGSDGYAGRYVVAASAGNSLVSGFCSWDFYSKEVLSHITREDGLVNTITALAPSPDNPWDGPSRGQKGVSIGTSTGNSCGKGAKKTNSLSEKSPSESPRWWYKPCGPIIISTGTCKKSVKLYDIRDGECPLKWKLEKPVLSMEYSSPLQWRSKGKVVIAEADVEQGETIISLWDVRSLNHKSLLSVSSAGRKVTAFHVNNTDAEMGGGVRQRVSSSEAEGNDGIFCTADDINVLDFRNPSGIGLKIPKTGTQIHSVFSRGDSIYLGSTTLGESTTKHSLIEQFSIRTQKLFSVYTLPEESNKKTTGITQVWGNSKFVMGVCDTGLSIFDSLNDDAVSQDTFHKGKSVIGDYGNAQKVKEVIGPNDMQSPSFDYLDSQVLLISRNGPAQWRYL